MSILIGEQDMQEQIPSSVRNALRQDISRLEDDCFGDLPIMQQRMMKSYAMMANRDTYIYEKMIISKNEPQKKHNILPDDSPETLMAQALVDEMVQKMAHGDSAASSKLKDYMKDKKLKVHIINSPVMDACCNGFDKKTKELHLSFCSGNFMYQNNCPDFANKDCFAVTIGHEIGHAIEQDNRTAKCSVENTQHSINGREVESFCDIFGLACAASGGYNLQSYINRCETFEKKELETRSQKGNTNDPHPSLSKRKRLASLVKQAYHNDMTEPTLFSEKITSMDWYKPQAKPQMITKTAQER